MARVKRAVNAHKKRRVILERAEGYRGQRSRLYRKAKEQVTHSLVYAYRDRRARRRATSVASGSSASTRHRVRTASPTTASSRASASRASRSTVASSPSSPSTSPRPSRRSSRPPSRRSRPTRRRRRPPRKARPHVANGPVTHVVPGRSSSAPLDLPHAREPALAACPRGRQARQEAGPRRDGLFLLEGPQAVAEALTFRPQLRRRAVRDARRRSSATPTSRRPPSTPASTSSS